ncbi:hypothetical protein J1N09_03515 [Aureitalea sp. L0-47]|uniref:hypothetical protein n=1 Tax=Aureitalea sp. L0-47 TaxID=2816962 RepID=UPI002238AC5D|nr:hypothetical protein [Aureitalea sp. L0-47]MCW5518892.1 hypothetical protein [Aureitalea sp. L0-47]
MKLPIVIMGFLFLINCGTPAPKSENEDIIKKDTVTQKLPPVEEITLPKIPENAVAANYRSGSPPFYGYVEDVNFVKATTTINFQDNLAPVLVIEESYGAQIDYLRFPEFRSDLLLVTSVIKDPNFNKYYLYEFRGDSWKEIVNGWAIHKDNQPDTLQPISVSVRKPNHMHRYYSVFDLDKESELGYTWRLLEETIPIIKE